MPVVLTSYPSDEDVVLCLTGDLVETEKFPEIHPRLSQRIILDCEGLRHINSYGAQLWSTWMHSLDPRLQFVFKNLPPRAVDLFNNIKNFLPKESTFESFYVPYDCENCGFESLQLAHRGREYLESQNNKSPILHLPQEINCPKCKNGMKISVWQNKFLRFLESQIQK